MKKSTLIILLVLTIVFIGTLYVFSPPAAYGICIATVAASFIIPGSQKSVAGED